MTPLRACGSTTRPRKRRASTPASSRTPRWATRSVTRRPGPGPEGQAMIVEFELNGQKFGGLNRGPAHTFSCACTRAGHWRNWRRRHQARSRWFHQRAAREKRRDCPGQLPIGGCRTRRAGHRPHLVQLGNEAVQGSVVAVRHRPNPSVRERTIQGSRQGTRPAAYRAIPACMLNSATRSHSPKAVIGCRPSIRVDHAT
jgi:hypothetical protein